MAIDLDKVVRKHAGKAVPQFLINRMKKFIHQDEINEFLVKGYEGVEFCTEAVKFLGINITVEGLENLEGLDGESLTFASNHPLGGVDGFTLTSLIGERYGRNIRLMVNEFLMNIKAIAPLSVPINMAGNQKRSISESINWVYSSPCPVLVFPSGLCSRKIDGKVQDLPWHKTFIQKSVQNHRTVVPVHFIGENSKRFYRVANLCKALKLKFNLAMLYLPDEMIRAKGNSYKVVFGKPIKPETFDKSRTAKEWAAYVREEVYKL